MTEIITSNKNQRVRNVAALQRSKKERTESGLFVVEGLRIFKDAVRSAPRLLQEVYVSESFDKASGNEIAAGLPERCEYCIVADSVFTAMCETVTPQGILAVVRQPEYTYESMLRNDGVRLLLLEDIQDPGNLGTMLRTAEAAGMTGVIMSRGTADMFSPKVTRSTMGAVFRVPFMYSDDLCGLMDRLKNDGVEIYAAYLHGGTPYREQAYPDRAAVLIGNEGNGLSDEAVAHASGRVFIPMSGEVESLNAAVAAALLMYEIKR